MVKEKEKRLTVDLRRECNFAQVHMPNRFKGLVIGYYALLFCLLGLTGYQVFNKILIKNELKSIGEQDSQLTVKIEELNTIQLSLQSQVKKANTLIGWQIDNIHGQKVLSTLLSKLPKEVLLERFSFKRSKSNHQATLIMELKGSYGAVHQEFEQIPIRLEAIGLKLISLDQVEMKEGMRLKCLCQFDILNKS